MENERGASQKRRVLEYIETVGPITPIEALNFFGCFRLAAIINVLRNEGHNITTEMVYEGDKHYARYHYKNQVNN